MGSSLSLECSTWQCVGDLPGVFLQGDRICSGAVNIGQPEFVFLSLQQKKPSSLSLSGNRRRRHINSALPLLLLPKAASRSQLPAFDPVNVLPCNGGTPVLTTGKTFTRTADRRGHLEPVATFHQWRLSGNRLTLNVMSCSLHLHVELLPF